MDLRPLRTPARVRPYARLARAGVLAACIPLASCISEVVSPKPQGAPVQRLTGGRIAPPDHSRPARPLPEGPVASPAKPTATIESRVVVAVRPMGAVPFDGQTLPLVSPDGRFLATQVGEPASWPTVFATLQRSAAPARAAVQLFDLSSEAAKRLNVAPQGTLLLGRDADEQGALVESVHADGSRSIARLRWDGQLEWLVQDGRVNAHAVFIPGGGLAFTRREIDSDQAALVIRSATGEAWTRRPERGVTYAFPIIDTSGAFVAAFAIRRDDAGVGDAGLELRVFPVSAEAASIPPVSSRVLSRSPDIALAYQAVASLQPAPHARTRGAAQTPGGASFLFLHPGLGRMVLLDVVTSELTALAERSIAGVPDDATAGYFLTTPRGLVHQRLADRSAEGGAPSALPEARVLSESWVPRVTTSDRTPFLLLGPSPGRTGELALTAMQVVPEPAAP